MSEGGWFGAGSYVEHVLRTLGADRDEEGRFLIGGGVFEGIGGQEVVVSPDAVYFVGGQPRGLASAMNATSYGVRGVGVIGREES